MKYESEKITMSDNNIVVLHHWLPDDEIKAVVLLSHGMVEHATRYEDLASHLTKKGYALYAEDHRGHGETGLLAQENGTGQLAYLADKDGFFRVVDDIHEEALLLRKRYPGKKLYLLGHSFGSFVTQCFIEKYGNCLDGVIICGSAGPRLAVTGFAKFIATLSNFFCGKKHTSKFIDRLAFGSYNKRIDDKFSSFAWLSRSKENVEKYVADPLCGMVCTSGFFCDLFTGLCWIHKKNHMAQVPENLPVFFIAGKEDPVGDYGKTVTNLFNIYTDNGVKDVKLKLYDGARHELFNETNKDEVIVDVLSWLESH